MANIRLCDKCGASNEDATVDPYKFTKGHGHLDLNEWEGDLCSVCLTKILKELNNGK